MLVAGSTHRPENCLTPEAEPARECRQKGGLGCEELTYFLESRTLSVASLRPVGGAMGRVRVWPWAALLILVAPHPFLVHSAWAPGHQPRDSAGPPGWLLHLCLVISVQYCQPGLVGTQCEEVTGFRGAWPGRGC